MTTITVQNLGLLSARERKTNASTTSASRSSMLTGASATGQVFYPRFPEEPVAAPREAWVKPTLDALGRLLDLPRGWDSYGANTIDPANVQAAIEIAFALLSDQTPAPSVVPTSSGGVQFEWHTRGIDLEIEVGSPARISASFEDERDGSAWHDEEIHDFRRLRVALRELTRR